MADNATVVEPPKRLPDNKFQIDEAFDYPRASVTLPVGWEFEEVLNPDFWVNIAPKFAANTVFRTPEKLGTIIAIRTEDHAFFAEVYVRALIGRGLKVAVVREPVYFGPRAVKSAGYEVRWSVGDRKHLVINKATKTVDFKAATKEDAQKWIDDAARAVAA